MNQKLRNLSYLIGSGAALMAPIAIVVACNNGDQSAAVIEISNLSIDNLQKVTATGDTRNLKFNVPKEVTNIDENSALSATGSRQAFDVHGRTSLPLGSNLANESALNNTAFMPLPLLEAYLSQRLSFENERLIMTSTDGRIDVTNTYGQNYGFTKVNVIRPKLLGVWAKSEFFLKYVALTGYSADAAVLKAEAPLNSAQLKTYVNLDNTLANSSEERTLAETAFALDAVSTQDNLVWLTDGNVSLLPQSWTSFATGASYLQTLTDTPTAALPKVATYVPSTRKLLLQLTPREGYSFGSLPLDVTAFTKLTTVKTKVDKAPNFDTLDLSKSKVAIVNNNLSFDTSMLNLPDGATVEFNIPGLDGWYDTPERLIFALGAAGLTTTLDVVNARLKSANTVNGVEYVVEDTKQAVATTVAGVNVVSSLPFFEGAAQNIRIDLATSNVNNLQWINVPTLASLPASLVAATERIEYVLSAQTLATQFDDKTAWSTTLPTVLPSALGNDVHFWARLVSKANYFVVPPVWELTATSNLPTLIKNLAEVDNQVVADAAAALKVTAESTHEALTWNDTLVVPSQFSAQIDAIQYLSGKYATLDQALAAPDSAWVSSLPEFTEPTRTDRNLWVRFVPVVGVRLKVRTVELTQTSGLRDVKAKIDAFDFYATYTSQSVGLNALNGALSFDEPTLPTGVKLQYRYAENAEWTTKEDLTTFITSQTVEPTLANINVRLAKVSDDYVLLNDKAGALTNGVTRIIWTSVFFNSLDTLKVDATSAANKLTWSSAPVLPDAISEGATNLQFLISDATDYASVASDVNWRAALPTAFDVKLTVRNLWVRLSAKDNYILLPTLSRSLAASSTGLDKINTTSVDVTTIVDGIDTTLFVTNTSTHDAVTFDNALVIPDEFVNTVDHYEYLSGDFATEAAAAASNLWTLQVPTSVDFDHVKRNLWVRLVPKSGYTLSTTYINQTVNSSIRNVRSKIDVTSAYEALDFGLIIFTGALLNFVADTSALTTLPIGTEVQYRITSVAKSQSLWMTLTELQEYFKTNIADLVVADMANIEAHLALIVDTSAKYLILNDKVKAVNVTNLKLNIVSDDPVAAANVELAKVVADLVLSNHSALVWDNAAFALPTGVGKVQYLSGNYPTLASANAALSADWKDALPLGIDYTHADRYLWSRPVAAAGYEFSNDVVRDLTTTSRVQEVKSLVDNAALYEALDLALIKLSGKLSAAVLDLSKITLPVGASIQFNIGAPVISEDPITVDNIVQVLKDEADQVSREELDNIEAYLVVTDETLYVLNFNKSKLVDATELTISSDAAAVNDALATVKPQAGSTHDSVTWSGITTLPDGVDSLTYLYSDTAATLAEAKAAPTSDYLAALPSSVSITHAKRNLFVLVKMKDGFALDEPYFNITTSSGVRDIVSNLTPTVQAANINLAPIKFTYDTRNARVDLSAAIVGPLPETVSIAYRVTPTNGVKSAWMTFETFRTYLLKNGADSVANTLTADVGKTIEAHVETSNTTLFIFKNDLATKVNGDSLINAFTTTVQRDLGQIRNILQASTYRYYNDGSTNDAVSWSPEPAAPNASYFEKLEYLVGDYAAFALAQGAEDSLFTTTLLPKISYDNTKRFIWLRLTVAAGRKIATSAITAARDFMTTNGYIYSAVSPGENISYASIPSKVDSTDEYTALDLSTVGLTGSVTNTVLNGPSSSLPVGASLTYRMTPSTSAASGWISKEAMIAYISNNAATLIASDFATLQVRISATSTSYLVVNDKMTNVDTSAFTFAN